jgi:hypothetical protein
VAIEDLSPTGRRRLLRAMNFKALMGERKRLVAAREKAQKRVTEIETAMADVYAAILDTDRTDPA